MSRIAEVKQLIELMKSNGIGVLEVDGIKLMLAPEALPPPTIEMHSEAEITTPKVAYEDRELFAHLGIDQVPTLPNEPVDEGDA